MANIKPTILIVRSITSAMRGQKILEQHGITSYIHRNQFLNENVGCGYGLKIVADPQKAIPILEQAGIRVSEVQGG